MQGQWSKKSVEFLLHMLKNAESNAEFKGLNVDSLIIEHVQENQQEREASVASCIVNKALGLWPRNLVSLANVHETVAG